jgi:hypothetical protein
MKLLTIGHWPDGRMFLVFDAFENGKLERVCWTPSKSEEATLRGVLSGMSQA